MKSDKSLVYRFLISIKDMSFEVDKKLHLTFWTVLGLAIS